MIQISCNSLSDQESGTTYEPTIETKDKKILLPYLLSILHACHKVQWSSVVFILSLQVVYDFMAIVGAFVPA